MIVVDVDGRCGVVIRQGQYEELHQRVRYLAGVAHEFLCPICGQWHAWDGPKWKDPVRGQYIGIDCAPQRPPAPAPAPPEGLSDAERRDRWAQWQRNWRARNSAGGR